MSERGQEINYEARTIITRPRGLSVLDNSVDMRNNHVDQPLKKWVYMHTSLCKS